MKLTREFYIPAKARRVAHKHSSAVAYVYETAGTPYAVAFAGKAAKPAWHFRFTSPEARAKRVSGFFDATQASERARRERRTELQAAPRGLELGDVLMASWGYEQTNIDWYEVTALIGANMVEIRELAHQIEETDWQQGKTVPQPGSYTSEPMRRRARNGWVRVDESRHARRVEPLASIGGKPVFAAAHFTAYH